MSETYDYIVIGAGSAGCVLARRLTENPDVNVLLLEAGPGRAELNPTVVADISIQQRWTQIQTTDVDWKYESEPQPSLNNRKIFLPRGRLVGGTSNFMPGMYVRGNRHNFDDWEAMGNPGWGFDDVLPFFIKKETNLGQGLAPGFHGFDGPLVINDFYTKVPSTNAFLEACKALGYPYNPDFNGPSEEGYGLVQFFINNTTRVNAASSYLTGKVLSRPNLTFRSNILATGLSHEQAGGRPRITGVEYQDRNGGGKKSVRAGVEVIVCGGTYNSPQFLMLSGIGPADELRKHNITPLVDLPGVGKNLQEDVVAPIAVKYSKETNPGQIVPLAQVGGMFLNTEDPAKPNQQYVFNSYSLGPPGVPIDPTIYSLIPVLPNPKSRGHVTLRSADPTAHPRIYGGFLEDPADMETLLDAVKRSLEIMNQSTFDELRGDRVLPPAKFNAQSDDDLRQYIREFAGVLYHPVGTCRMGPDPHDPQAPAVVNHELKVHGVDGLRVIDGSIMPTKTTGNTHSPIVMIAEKGAEMIKIEDSSAVASPPAPAHIPQAPPTQSYAPPPTPPAAPAAPAPPAPAAPPAAGGPPAGVGSGIPFLDLSKEMGRLGMAMSLFGAKQMTSMLDPKAPAALSAVTDSIKGQLGGPAGQLFELGDRIQQGILGANAPTAPSAVAPPATAAPATPTPSAPDPEQIVIEDPTLHELEAITTAVVKRHLDGGRYALGGDTTSLPPPFTAPSGPIRESVPSPSEFPFTPPIMREGKYIDILGSKMHYLEQGTGDPILFLHGDPLSSYVWRNIIPFLAPHGRCIAPDLIGMGYSYKPNITYTYDENFKFVEAFIEKMGLKNVTLVLHDWGSGLGFNYAMKHQDNVKGLAFMEAVLEVYPTLDDMPPGIRPLTQRFQSPNSGMYVIVGMNVFMDDFIPGMVERKLTSVELANYRAPFNDPASRYVIWRWARAVPVAGKPPDAYNAVVNYLKKLQVSPLPKLLLYADPGAIITAKQVKWAKQHLPNLETKFLGPGLHILQEDHPVEIGKTIAAWYQKINQPGGGAS